MMNNCIRPGRSRQRGVVLIFTLIVLLILTIGAVALMRSMNTSLFGAGNLAFRRDLVNQGEQAVSNVMTQFQTGGLLSTSSSTTADVPTSNYSASILPANAEGVPNVLLNDASFAATWTGPDISGPPNSGITMRYIIDRLCATRHHDAKRRRVRGILRGAHRRQGGWHWRGCGPHRQLYTGCPCASAVPRSTQIFLQTTFTRPD